MESETEPIQQRQDRSLSFAASHLNFPPNFYSQSNVNTITNEEDLESQDGNMAQKPQQSKKHLTNQLSDKDFFTDFSHDNTMLQLDNHSQTQHFPSNNDKDFFAEFTQYLVQKIDNPDNFNLSRNAENSALDMSTNEFQQNQLVARSQSLFLPSQNLEIDK